jgi:hypothetical protein
MLRRVALVRTDVSEELSASITRVARIHELARTLAETSNRRTLRRNTNADSCHPDDGGAKFFETSVLTRATLRYFPEDGTFHSPAVNT